jgi:hypothetical protein
VSADLVRLTVVPSDLDAEMIQRLLATEGIEAFRKLTDFGAGATDGFGRGGQHEVLVRSGDLERARELIADR